MKTTEEKRVAVLQFCAEVCPDTYRPRVMFDRFVSIWRKLKWNLEPYFEVIIGNNTMTVDENFTHWDFLYSALGLEARDAVQAERAKSAALVEFAKHCAKTFEGKGLATMANEALEAHKKGGRG